jgi:hypothetical protein
MFNTIKNNVQAAYGNVCTQVESVTKQFNEELAKARLAARSGGEPCFCGETVTREYGTMPEELKALVRTAHKGHRVEAMRITVIKQQLVLVLLFETATAGMSKECAIALDTIATEAFRKAYFDEGTMEDALATGDDVYRHMGYNAHMVMSFRAARAKKANDAQAAQPGFSLKMGAMVATGVVLVAGVAGAVLMANSPDAQRAVEEIVAGVLAGLTPQA